MIDWERVSELQNDVGAEGFDDVISLFLDEVDGVVARLQTTPDLATLGEDLHFLKGSAMGLGFAAFANLCQVGESLCAQGNASDVELATTLQAYADSKRLFQEEMPTALAG